MAHLAGGPVDAAQARRWLTNLARPERLADAPMRALLRAHGRDGSGPPLEAGRDAARLLENAIAALAPAGRVPPAQALPHRVLTTCFVEGLKNRAAAAQLGLSERQLSRERTRAICLLAAQLGPPLRAGAALPPRLPDPFLPRPPVAAALAAALEEHRRVHVAGGPGCGKTTVVAAHAGRHERPFWFRDSALELPSLLFELGEHLASDDPSLAAYVRGALPSPDLGLATRIALAALGGKEHLLVFDGYERGLDRALDSFVDEAATRLPLLSVVTIGRGTPRPPCVRVPELTVAETRSLLALHGAGDDDDRLARELHAWTAGNPRLVSIAARRLVPSRAVDLPPEVDPALRQHPLLLENLRGLTRAARRAA